MQKRYSNMFQRLSAQNFKKKLDTWRGTLLDIRTSYEQALFWVISENQIHIDISLPKAIEKINQLDKNKTYLIYCWHGNRSQHIGEYMSENGFTEVSDLMWGIEEWKKL